MNRPLSMTNVLGTDDVDRPKLERKMTVIPLETRYDSSNSEEEEEIVELERSIDPILKEKLRLEATNRMIERILSAQRRVRMDASMAKSFRPPPCIFTHRVYLKASRLYGHYKPELKFSKTFSDADEEGIMQTVKFEVPTFSSDQERQMIFQLVLSTLKYEDIVRRIIEEISFFNHYMDLAPAEHLVVVMLTDLMQRKFRTRVAPDGEDRLDECEDIEEALEECRIKLDAALARYRIKFGVRHIDEIVSPGYKEATKMVDAMPIYLWINRLKTMPQFVYQELQSEGFLESDDGVAGSEPRTFVRNRCSRDVLAFAREDKEAILTSRLVKELLLVPQDLSTCLTATCTMGMVQEEEEIIVYRPTSLLTAVHVESLLFAKYGESMPLVRVILPPNAKQAAAHKVLEQTASQKIKLHFDNIGFPYMAHERFKAVSHAFFQANCSRSGVINPVDFIIHEGDDMQLLIDFSSCFKTGLRPKNFWDKINKTLMDLRIILSTPQLRTCTFLTNSIYEEENEILLEKAVNGINRLGKHAEPYCMCPPLLPLNANDMETKLRGKFLFVRPSAESNGCFLATIVKEYSAQKDTKALLLRAKKKGLLDLGAAKTKKKKKKKKSSN